MFLTLKLAKFGSGSKNRATWVAGGLVGSASKNLKDVSGVTRVHESRTPLVYWMGTKDGVGYSITSRKIAQQALNQLHELSTLLSEN